MTAAKLSRTRLERDEVEARAASLEGWSTGEDGRGLYIEKEYVFSDFVAAFAFMAAVALRAEKADHHPEWSNVYNRVKVVLRTHDAGGVTEHDFALAEAAERAAPRP